MTYLAVGRIEQADSHVQEALALTRRLGARGSEAHALCLAGDVASAGGAEAAEGYYHEALALAGELGMRPLVAHCHLGLGKLYRRTGKREQAQEHLTTATTMYREMGMQFWREKTEKELGAAVAARLWERTGRRRPRYGAGFSSRVRPPSPRSNCVSSGADVSQAGPYGHAILVFVGSVVVTHESSMNKPPTTTSPTSARKQTTTVPSLNLVQCGLARYVPRTGRAVRSVAEFHTRSLCI